MKFLKPLFYTAFIATALTGCKTISNIPVPSASNIIVNAVAKKAPLTEAQAQTWGHLDLATDSIPGMSVEKAYKFLEGKKSVTVIVAIADSGLDIEHEDLKDVIWTNSKEIAGNGIDDDKNGYIDDVHGWNFLGNKDGKIVIADQLEITRIVKAGMEKFDGKKASDIAEADKTAYQEFLKHKEIFDKVASGNIKTSARLNQIATHFAMVKKALGKNTYTVSDLKAAKPADAKIATAISDISSLLSRGFSEKGFLDYKSDFEKKKHYDLDFNSRQSMGDNLYDINDAYYGNNNVIGSKDDESHGTHVGGIVAASRNNQKGANGVANNVKLMPVRVVPDGDEHDKDVALGIRYAVDNGAKVINTSFGKGQSPNKQWVYDAIKYAADHDVLIVNAAGNDGANIDVVKTYPNDSKDLLTEIADNVITIGAMSSSYNENLPAIFSNYGKINVDVFAPGVQIYATMPKDEYAKMSGTSMAAPSTAGVAAMIRSYYPKLSASQVKHILMNSGVKIDFDVIQPGSKSRETPKGKMVSFASLSVSGRVVNAYNAVRMADQMVNGN